VIVQRRAERTAVPWRNGMGVQYEIDSDHPTDWSWRLSTADIDRDVPFSSFPGVHRVFCVAGGAGVTLGVNGDDLRCATGSVTRFEGGDEVDARTWDGSVQAVNLMWRDGAAWRDLHVLGGGESVVGVLAVVASGAAQVVIDGARHELAHLDALLRLGGHASVDVEHGAVVAVVRGA
jgi:environmental stress-induced protein Ves